jgi:hypothetical protein
MEEPAGHELYRQLSSELGDGGACALLRYRVFMASIQQPGQASKDPAVAAEAVRVQRLREDAQRPMSVNLAETIALSHALLKMAAPAQRQ